MQFDHNRIVIRERGYLDLLDLALCVIRAYAGPLLGTLVLGILPAMALNAWLLADQAEPGFNSPVPYEYMWLMLLLVLAEAPLATALATLYLGHAVFMERPSLGNVLRDFGRSLPQMLFYQGLLRAMLLPWVVTWFLPFAAWPYLNEVLLLERNPWRRHRPGEMTTYRRTMAFHRGGVGDLFACWLGTIAFGSLLFASLWISMIYGSSMLLSEEAWKGPAFTLYYPLALWIVVGYFTVVRFLGYLDLRIRREGWEVELLMRAEGARLARQLT